METKQQCCEEVWDTGGWHKHGCPRGATIERNGKPYCKVHDPEYIKEKQANRTAKWEANWQKTRRDRMAISVTDGITTEELQKITPAMIKAAPEMVKVLETLIDTYWKNKGSNGKTCPHPAEFIACITPTRIPDYWKRADVVLAKAKGEK